MPTIEKSACRLNGHWGGQIHLLNDTAAVHLRRQLEDLSAHAVCEEAFLVLIAVLEEFLDDIVSKDILHQLQRVALELVEYTFLFVAVRRLEFLLDEAGPVLVAAELDHVVVNVLPR